jgi:hypothetical protein
MPEIWHGLLAAGAVPAAHGQAWADFDVYMPDRSADDLPRRRAAGIPAGLEFATKPQLAMRQLERLADAALDLQGGMMALVALRDAAAKVFRLATAGRLIAVFRTVAEVAARD